MAPSGFRIPDSFPFGQVHDQNYSLIKSECGLVSRQLAVTFDKAGWFSHNFIPLQSSC